MSFKISVINKYNKNQILLLRPDYCLTSFQFLSCTKFAWLRLSLGLKLHFKYLFYMALGIDNNIGIFIRAFEAMCKSYLLTRVWLQFLLLLGFCDSPSFNCCLPADAEDEGDEESENKSAFNDGAPVAAEAVEVEEVDGITILTWVLSPEVPLFFLEMDIRISVSALLILCLLYTSDAADE